MSAGIHIHVIATDLNTGKVQEVVLNDGDHVIVTAGRSYLASDVQHANGTRQVTIKVAPKPAGDEQ